MAMRAWQQALLHPAGGWFLRLLPICPYIHALLCGPWEAGVDSVKLTATKIGCCCAPQHLL